MKVYPCLSNGPLHNVRVKVSSPSEGTKEAKCEILGANRSNYTKIIQGCENKLKVTFT